MSKQLKKIVNRAPLRKRGVTIIEVMVVTTVVALLAAVSFPVYKIIQQREKEKRLKDILLNVRAAISGSKTARSNKLFRQGYRNYVVTKGVYAIEKAHPNDSDAQNAAIAKFLASGTACDGTLDSLYPASPSALLRATTYSVRLATDTDADTNSGSRVTVTISRRFLRSIPPHPFVSWYPNAHWEFKPVVTNIATATKDSTYASGPGDPWGNTDYSAGNWNATGVVDIVSRGAGIALDGSNTDDW